MDAVKKILDLPDNVEAFFLFPLGYPAEIREQQDKFEMDRIHSKLWFYLLLEVNNSKDSGLSNDLMPSASPCKSALLFREQD